MNLDYLEFEQPIANLEEKIDELRRIGAHQDLNIVDEIAILEKKSAELTRTIYSDLTDQQVVQVARHPKRPYTMDYIDRIFTEFDELHGDRHSSNGASIVGGLAKLNNQSVMVIGHQKGRTTKEKVARNFGMASPEAFRKALRLMKLAEKFTIPVLTFIDTPGAYPGITAEEKNQSEAIARNLYEMAELKTPIIATILGEGCSGGALALGVSDRTLMLQYSYYSVISPEGCASILWKSAEKAGEAASALNLTAKRLKSLKLIHEVIEEPLGGSHRNADEMAERLKQRLIANLKPLQKMSVDELLNARQHFWMHPGE